MADKPNVLPTLRISLRDGTRGYDVEPSRVPLSLLREFSSDVDKLLKGKDGEIKTSSVEIAIVKGSFAVEVLDHLVAPRLFHDLSGLTTSPILDLLDNTRAAVIDKWQKRAKTSSGVSYLIESGRLETPIVISSDSDFHRDDADQWVRVERYLRGEIEDLGGSSKSNAHLRLPNGVLLPIETTKDLLRDEQINRLYKPSMIRFRADFNIVTHEYKNAELIEFVDYSPKFDETSFARLTERGKDAWRDVEDPSAWVESLRGSGN
jgi:hypothetical protein